MRYLNATAPLAGEDRKKYTTADGSATAGQTVFNVSYDGGRVAAFLNGVRLVPVNDFTLTSTGFGTQIVLASGITANDYLELIGFQGINQGSGITEDRFVVGTSSIGSGGDYPGNNPSTTVFPVSHAAGDLVSVWRNGVKLVLTTDYTTSPSAGTITLVSAAETDDEITVHTVGIVQHNNFVQSSGGTFTGTVNYSGTLNVLSGGVLDLTSASTLSLTTAQKEAIVDQGKGNLTKVDVGLDNVPNVVPMTVNGGTFVGSVTHELDTTFQGNIVMVTNKKVQQKGAFMQSSTHQALTLG